ncbi:MAG: RNA 2',3'-cyclic phosphodiesterase [Bacteroidales bacterium]|nr:RNA 2',3'-cyclic phosphodiesterase [Bacteroidales bacterium]
MKRVFLGIRIEAEKAIIETIDKIKIDLRAENIRWVNTENYHITIKFFGNTEPERIELIDSLLKKLSGNYKAIRLDIFGAGYFKRDSKPKILWLGSRNDKSLISMVTDIDESLVQIGYNKEKRPFKSHLTIGSIRYINNMENFERVIVKHSDRLIQSCYIKSLVFYESILKPGGPEYIELYNYQLGL